MLSLTVRTKKSVEEAERAVRDFFGRDLGLEESREHGALQFTGGGGFVSAAISSDDETVIDFQTREFDRQVQKFAREL